MAAKATTNLQPNTNPETIAAIGGLIARDFRNAESVMDLDRRLARKGYGIDGQYLVTTPHGKRICPLTALNVR